MNETMLAHGGDKIQANHRLRLACIYIRQSSPSQRRDNKESLRLQYQLMEKAEKRGWSPANIRMIDDDLGTSERSSEGRLGFQELVNLVSLGKVGIIFGYEVSRLARNMTTIAKAPKVPSEKALLSSKVWFAPRGHPASAGHA